MKDIIIAAIQRTNLMRLFITVVIMGIFFMIVNALIYRIIPDENKEILIHVLGIVEGGVMTVYNYEFGSSKGSAKKTELIDKITDKTTTDKS